MSTLNGRPIRLQPVNRTLRYYTQDAEPSIDADGIAVIWKDTNDSDRVWLVFRRGTGDQVKVELV